MLIKLRSGQPRMRSAVWTIRGSLSRKLYWSIAAASFCLWIAAWWAVTALQLVDPLFLPSPGAVVRRFGVWVRDGGLLKDAGISIFRVAAGVLLSAAIAPPPGLLLPGAPPGAPTFGPASAVGR